ncbi:MAG: hypothetical protein O2819_08855 [Planctomycetota bacterium]|nr:hypothetical protein [Planctomycetota bacterium]MDA1105893.1 hypothetical protein [Planctomycetota bacterium]
MSPRAGKAAIVIGFLALCAAAFVWAGGVVAETRRQAKITDECLQSAAWLLLCYASEHDGRFPPTEDAYWDYVGEVMDAGSHTCASLPQGEEWPESPALAGASMLEPGELPEVRKRVTVNVAEKAREAKEQGTSDESGKPPILGTPGKPSGLGTLEKVNGWLKAWSDAHAVPAAPPASMAA